MMNAPDRLLDRSGTDALRDAAARLAHEDLSVLPAFDHSLREQGMQEVGFWRQRTRALSTLGERLERQADWDEAILLYRRAIEVDPLVEEFHRRLMLYYGAQEAHRGGARRLPALP